MNRRTSAILAVSLTCCILAVQPAKAQVFELATGIAGDLVDGVLFGVARVASPTTPLPTTYASQLPPPSAGIYQDEQPACRIRRVHTWNGYGWVYRRIEVCG
jgi:hypothetical protein